jgi:two-component system phosphate regulon sensor histidine kinase PhoR
MPLPALAEALRFFDRSLVGVLFFLGVTFTAFSAWTGRRLVVPLGRLLQKARGVSERGEPEGASRAEVDAEWSDLESSLDRIQSHLQSKTETLAREREELATLMSAISEAIVAVDREGIPLFYNSHFAVSFLPRPIGLKSTAIPSLGEVFRAPEVLEAFDRAWVSGLNQSVEVRLHPLSSGAGAGEALSRYYRLSVAPLRRSGEIYGAVGIFHDITELKQVEQIRIDFVANVSHELRTPLTSIKGYTDTLRDDLREGKLESAEKFFEIIGRNVDRLMSLISDLLDLSSLESSSPNSLPNGVQKVSVSTEELTRRVLGQLEKLRAKKAHQVETRFVAPYVDAQPERVEQVLTNLLENAIKYLPEGGRIRVVWEPLPQAVLLRVADNGPGIPPEHQTRLFERFYRIDKGRSRELGGTGLGLAIVKHIMQVHGGSVYVASEPGKGAEFVCQFPNASS